MARFLFYAVVLMLIGWIIVVMSGGHKAEQQRQKFNNFNAENDKIILEKELDQARRIAEISDQPIPLTLVNTSLEPVFVKAVNAFKRTNTATNVYWTFTLAADQRLQTELPEGVYYVKVRFGESDNFLYRKSTKFTLDTNTKTIITLGKITLGKDAYDRFTLHEIRASEF